MSPSADFVSIFDIGQDFPGQKSPQLRGVTLNHDGLIEPRNGPTPVNDA